MAEEQLKRAAFTVTCSDQTFRDVIATPGADFRIKLKILKAWKQGSIEAKQVKFRWSITDTTPFLFQQLVDDLGTRKDVDLNCGEDYLIGPKNAALQVQAADGQATWQATIFGTALYTIAN